MSTSAKRAKKTTRSYRPTSALAKSIEFTDDMMHVHLLDGRIIGVPLAWSPRLLAATPRQRKKYEIGGGGIACTGKNWMKICPSPVCWRGRIKRRDEGGLVLRWYARKGFRHLLYFPKLVSQFAHSA
jgi:hypothetical protein